MAGSNCEFPAIKLWNRSSITILFCIIYQLPTRKQAKTTNYSLLLISNN